MCGQNATIYGHVMYQLDTFCWKQNVRDQGTSRLCEVVVLSLLVAVGCPAAATGLPSSAADARTGGGSSPGMVAPYWCQSHQAGNHSHY